MVKNGTYFYVLFIYLSNDYETTKGKFPFNINSSFYILSPMWKGLFLLVFQIFWWYSIACYLCLHFADEIICLVF